MNSKSPNSVAHHMREQYRFCNLRKRKETEAESADCTEL